MVRLFVVVVTKNQSFDNIRTENAANRTDKSSERNFNLRFHYILEEMIILLE